MKHPSMLIYALTIFISAFLLFQVQPMIAKIILPWFGGGAAVWSACLMFFQIALLLGYLYSHATTKWLKPRQQAMLHTVVLIVAVFLLPIMPGQQWKPLDEKDPLLRIFLLLCGIVGLPYLMLSTTGPLLQAWYSRASGGAMPYRLFALSNFGSFLALLSFPFVFEPRMTSVQQTNLWSVAFAVFAACAVIAGWKTVRAIPESSAGGAAASADDETPLAPIPFGRLLLWVALAACASIMLIAVSSHLTTNVAPIPFLWVVPLSIYLLTFILSFESDRVYSRGTFMPLLVAALGVAAFLLTEENRDGFGPIYLWSVILFISCMICHGELALQKPHPKQLTLFFLMVSVGGAIGGLFVAMAAPVFFNNYYELAISLGLCGVLAMGILWDEVPETWKQSQGWAVVGLAVIVLAELWYHAHSYLEGYPKYAMFALTMAFSFIVATGVTWIDFLKNPLLGFSWPVRIVWAGLLLANLARLRFPDYASEGLEQFCLWTSFCAFAGLILCWRRGDEGRLDGDLLRYAGVALCGALLVHLVYYQHQNGLGYRMIARNFYGGLKVRDEAQDEETTGNRALVHGTINHGAQLLDPARRREPTSYYGPKSGFGKAVKALRELAGANGIRVGITGLGAGVTASFCRPGDYFRFYELNPMVLEIARTQFTFYNDCPADKDVYLGDGRLALERQNSHQFDLLAMDAFSSDSVPVHLLTKEAFGLYVKHLKSDGVVAINVSNRYLNLVPVVTRNGHEFGMKVALVEDDGNDADFYSATSWMLCSRSTSLFKSAEFQGKNVSFPEDSPNIRQWTDAFSNLFQIMK
jgi:hypothetical protein